MAMHKELQVNTFITCFPVIKKVIVYDRRRNEQGIMTNVRREQNTIEIKALYVYNRRARTNGATIPKDLIPFLESLKVRVLQRRTHMGPQFDAVGCTTHSLGSYHLRHNHRIPPDAIKRFRDYKEHLPGSIIYSDYVNKKLSQFSNIHKRFSLYPPSYSLLGIAHIEKVTALPEVDTWI